MKAKLVRESMNKPILKIRDIDRNVFALLGKARRLARFYEMDFEEIRKEAMSDDYDHVLRILMKYFDVE